MDLKTTSKGWQEGQKNDARGGATVVQSRREGQSTPVFLSTPVLPYLRNLQEPSGFL